MYAIFCLFTDNSRIRYLLDHIELDSLTIEQISCNYHDKLVLFEGNVYLNGAMISKNHELSLYHPEVAIRNEAAEKVNTIKDLSWQCNLYSSDATGSKLYYCSLYNKQVYYVCQTDGRYFEINKIINLEDI